MGSLQGKNKDGKKVVSITRSQLYEVVDQRVDQHGRTQDFQLSGYVYQRLATPNGVMDDWICDGIVGSVRQACSASSMSSTEHVTTCF